MSEILTTLRDFLADLADLLWTALAWLLDVLGQLGPLAAGLVVLTVAAFSILGAHLMQRLLVRRLSTRPDQPVRFRELETWFFLPAWLVLPFVVLWRGLRALWRILTGWVDRRRNDQGQDQGQDKKEEPPAPFLAASLGPSFLMAGLVVAFVYLAAKLAEPLLAARLELAPGASAWEHLALGGRPELALWLPLGRTAPFLAAVLVFVIWTVIWWWVARGLRLFHWKHLGRNLLNERQRPETLSRWRRWGAVRHLVKPAPPYRVWAGSLVAVGLPLAAWGWFTLADVPYRVAAADLAVALVVLVGWVVHLTVSGAERLPEVKEQTESVPEEEVRGWPEVRDDLVERLQIEIPPPFRPLRPVPSLPRVQSGVEEDPLLSPLLEELVPEQQGRRHLTVRQREELHRLSRLGHVFTRPRNSLGELTLGRSGEEEFEVRERNRILLAPEGSGKTTLAILAAANHALVHTRATLLVVRDAAAEKALYERIHNLLDPSTLRWTLRLRRVGGDLVQDCSRGIVPDLVVTSLRNLTVEILQHMETFAPLLHRLGLIVVDDVESFAGNVETHAQLAFRRLTLVARKVLGVEELGEQGSDLAPLVLALGTDSMHRTATWIEDLLGIEAEVEHHRPEEESTGGGQVQEMYRLSDFRAATGEQLDPVEVVESCERLGVPWHYRRCTDGERHLGRTALRPRDEPECFTPDPRLAAVLLLEGAWSEVRRELDRLVLAGDAHSRTPCAVLTLVDPDEDMAFTQLDDRLSLATELAALPRPILRPPSGRTVGSHLAADLTQSWTEVEDVLETFGNATAHKLRELAEENLLLTERRVDVHHERDDYLEKLYVRALHNAVAGDHDPPHSTPLPPVVAQVELATEKSIEVKDRTDQVTLDRVDADSAGLAFHPGRIFTQQGRRYIVVHHASEEGGLPGMDPATDPGRIPPGTILVEPMLGDEVSSPRRRVRLEAILATGEAGRKVEERRDGKDGAPILLPTGPEAAITGHAFYGPDPLRIGESAIQVELALVKLRATHYATYLLGPTFCEIRQRRLYSGEEAGGGKAGWETHLTTVALCIYPNPDGTPQGPALRLNEARLVAAAMRAVLPSMYRGGGDGIAVALHVKEDKPEPKRKLEPWEGFVLFDLHNLGNGTARAIYRDGVDLLLRLVRLHLERVLYHDRLLALHDHWANGPGESELYTDMENEDPGERPEDDGPDEAIPADAVPAADLVDEGGQDGGDEADEGRAGKTQYQEQQERRKHEAKVRKGALNWLDSRLRPEGDAAAFSGALGHHVGQLEQGEGDVIDIGRCWYSTRESVTNLVWVKHRWRLRDGDEAMLDVGFERRVVDRARDTAVGDPLHERGRRIHLDHLGNPDYAEKNGPPWGAPREVWRVEGEEHEPHSSQPGQGGSAVETFHGIVAGWAAHDWPHLGPLAGKLSERRTGSQRKVKTEPPKSEKDRYALASYLAAFVQGIPTRRSPGGDGPPNLRPAVTSLLERRADVHEKSLLLALLLEACGIPAGLMVSLAENRTLTAAALPDPVEAKELTSIHFRDDEGKFAKEEDSTGKAEHFARSSASARQMYTILQKWSEAVALGETPRCWSVLKARTSPVEVEDGVSQGSEPASQAHLFVPIETATARLPGKVGLTKPGTWVFLPLVTVLHHLQSHTPFVGEPGASAGAPDTGTPTEPEAEAGVDGSPKAEKDRTTGSLDGAGPVAEARPADPEHEADGADAPADPADETGPADDEGETT